MQWSTYQQACFGFAEAGEANGFINAVAGSGKTTVIVECIERLPITQSVLAVAFGRDIKKTLEGKLGHLPNVVVKTLNGFGYSACRSALRSYINIKGSKVEDTMFYDIIGGKTASKESRDLYYKTRFLISKIIGIFKADMTWQPKMADAWEVLERFDLNLPKHVSEAQFWSLLETTFKTCMTKTKVMDFDDQIAMPIFHNWPLDTYDRIFVDEAQDLTPAQIELTRRACANGRAIYVGDPRQAIYQFRGADSNAVGNIIKSLDCTELPLSISYRCSKAVVLAAQKIVPHIEFHEKAPEGSVEVIPAKDFEISVQDKDLILCRCTAPLVRACLGFIRLGRKATIKGREIGQQLADLVSEIGGATIEDFVDRLNQYVSEQEEKLNKSRREAALIQLYDTRDTLMALVEKARSVPDMSKMILEIFSETREGIWLMTVHKAKGLEADTVFILSPELMPHKLATTDEAQLSEANLAYVAVTRAKKHLRIVGSNLSYLE